MPTYPAGVETVGVGQWPYDDGSMVPYPPDAFERLATRVALMAGAGVAYCPTTSARTALVNNGDAFKGLLVYDAQVDQYLEYNGSGWTWIAGTPTMGKITAATGWSVSATSFIRQRGKSVHMHAQFVCSSTVSAGAPVATITAGMAPSDQAGFVVPLVTGGATGFAGLVISSAGAVGLGAVSNTAATTLDVDVVWEQV